MLCLQELKCSDDRFPLADLESLGYHCAVLGQKIYNGVAVCSKYPIEEKRMALSGPQWGLPEAAWVIGARIRSTWVYSVYVPNGQAVGGIIGRHSRELTLATFSGQVKGNEMGTSIASLDSVGFSVLVFWLFNGVFAMAKSPCEPLFDRFADKMADFVRTNREPNPPQLFLFQNAETKQGKAIIFATPFHSADPRQNPMEYKTDLVAVVVPQHFYLLTEAYMDKSSARPFYLLDFTPSRFVQALQKINSLSGKLAVANGLLALVLSEHSIRSTPFITTSIIAATSSVAWGVSEAIGSKLGSKQFYDHVLEIVDRNLVNDPSNQVMVFYLPWRMEKKLQAFIHEKGWSDFTPKENERKEEGTLRSLLKQPGT